MVSKRVFPSDKQHDFPADMLAKFRLGARVYCGEHRCGCEASLDYIDQTRVFVLTQRHGRPWATGWMVNCYYHRNLPPEKVSFEILYWGKDGNALGGR